MAGILWFSVIFPKRMGPNSTKCNLSYFSFSSSRYSRQKSTPGSWRTLMRQRAGSFFLFFMSLIHGEGLFSGDWCSMIKTGSYYRYNISPLPYKNCLLVLKLQLFLVLSQSNAFFFSWKYWKVAFTGQIKRKFWFFYTSRKN